MSRTILYTKLGWQCNAKCIFCAVGGDSSPRELSTEEVVKQLQLGREHDAQMLSISGGEPTVRRDLPTLVEQARHLGYESVQILTNGRALSSHRYCQRLVRAGVTKFVVSLHGHTGELHDSLTMAPGSFKQTLRGIRNLVQFDIPRLVSTNTTIVKRNYPFVKEIVMLLGETGVPYVNLSYVQPSGSARKHMEALSPKMSKVAEVIRNVFQNGDPFTRVTVDGIPSCLLRDYAHNVKNQLYPLARLIDECEGWHVYRVMESYGVDHNGQLTRYPAVLKILPPGAPLEEEEEVEPLYYADDCIDCKFRKECPGIWDYYVTRYGLDEFTSLASQSA